MWCICMTLENIIKKTLSTLKCPSDKITSSYVSQASPLCFLAFLITNLKYQLKICLSPSLHVATNNEPECCSLRWAACIYDNYKLYVRNYLLYFRIWVWFYPHCMIMRFTLDYVFAYDVTVITINWDIL